MTVVSVSWGQYCLLVLNQIKCTFPKFILHYYAVLLKSSVGSRVKISNNTCHVVSIRDIGHKYRDMKFCP